MAAPDPGRVLAIYIEGVDALESIAGRRALGGWLVPCCGQWTATDLAGHLLVVAGWYHQWLGRALQGESSAPFVASDLAARNAAALAQLDAAEAELEGDRGESPSGSGQEAEDRGSLWMSRFAESARRYAERAAPHWGLPFGFPHGRVTVGVHLGAAAAEWHLHAWDLSTLDGAHHRPSDPALLYELLGTALTAGRTSLLPSRLSIGMARRTARRSARRHPDVWDALLDRSGRQPGRAGRAGSAG